MHVKLETFLIVRTFDMLTLPRTIHYRCILHVCL